jgi:hypothetical protein
VTTGIAVTVALTCDVVGFPAVSWCDVAAPLFRPEFYYQNSDAYQATQNDDKYFRFFCH